jgi:hypothetical protein
VRLAVVGGGAMVCLRAVGGPMPPPGAMLALLPAAVLPAAPAPLMLALGALPGGVLTPPAAAEVILLGLDLAAGVVAFPFVFGTAVAGLGGGAGCSSTVIAGDGCIKSP